MGVPHPAGGRSSFLDLIGIKVRSWFADLSWVSSTDNLIIMSGEQPIDVCRDCQAHIAMPASGHRCRSCRRLFCAKCMHAPTPPPPCTAGSDGWGYPDNSDGLHLEFCKFCFQAIHPVQGEVAAGLEEKLNHYAVSPTRLFCDQRAHLMEGQDSNPLALHFSTTRSYEEDDDDYRKHFLSPSSIFSREISDLETSSFCTSSEFYSFKSSPLDSPNGADQQTEGSPASLKPDLLDHEYVARPRTPTSETEDPLEQTSEYADNSLSLFQEAPKPLDFESNSLIWVPPQPKDETDDIESKFFAYDDDEDGDIGGTGVVFKSCSFDSDAFAIKDKPNDGQKEILKSSVHKHFRALVLQLLKDEGISVGIQGVDNAWWEVVSSLAWQAANYVKPDTSRGGSMDPGDYVKVKCVLAGSPSHSTLIKGVVCTRNVKHKRMITQHVNPVILILGGALEYQKVPDKLASINNVLEQETDQLKITFSKIETHRPNILLVEKSVSPYAVDYMLARGISLVANVKRSLLERISRCTGARITESIDDISSTRLGQCEAFHIERVSEECPTVNHPHKRSNKTLMFFEGCPRRLGCTVLLKGTCLEELKKVKHALQYAIFAAYHLSLETSFLVDEGATLPDTITPGSSVNVNGFVSTPSSLHRLDLNNLDFAETQKFYSSDKLRSSFHLDCHEASQSVKTLCIHPDDDLGPFFDSVSSSSIPGLVKVGSQDNGTCSVVLEAPAHWKSRKKDSEFSPKLEELPSLSVAKLTETEMKSETVDGNAAATGYPLAADNNQSILVSLSKSCIPKGGTVCEKSQLLRIKFYGSFDKPLGRYLHENLFDQTSCCKSCKEPPDAHVLSYTHQHGSLTISVKHLPSVKLPGERDGRIWMWHRCLKCAHRDGVPPAAKRVIMSDAAWGLSFGKFLELSFSNHTTANRVASCGHSLQKDCLRFYGFGSMVAFFRYSPVDILLVHLPASILDFTCRVEQEWLQKEAMEVSSKMECLYAEVFDILHRIEQKISTSECEPVKSSLLRNITDLKDLLRRERNDYDVLLESVTVQNKQVDQKGVDILELNNIKRSLLIELYMWDRRICLLDSMIGAKNLTFNIDPFLDTPVRTKLKEWIECPGDGRVDCSFKYSGMKSLRDVYMDVHACGEDSTFEGFSCADSNISDKIDLAWTGSGQSIEMQRPTSPKAGPDNLHVKKVVSPLRVYSFDSASRLREKAHKLSHASRHLSSFNTYAYEDFGVSKEAEENIQSVCQHLSRDAQNLKFLFGQTPSFISSTSQIVGDGARLLLPQHNHGNICIAVYDNEPSSIISYALSSKEHADFVACVSDSGWNGSHRFKDGLLGSQTSFAMSAAHAVNCNESDDVSPRFYRSDETLPSQGRSAMDAKQSHFRFSFDDESSFPSDKSRFSVTCYFAKQFSALRKKCCPNEMDFLRSLGRCKKWSAQGGKSNVYFAKSLDERFILKQVTKTELDAFEEFAPDYFSYLMESISSGSPTSLAKVLGVYQVTVKNVKGGKEVRMELMVMENLFFGRSISRIYDLKGSLRSRYVPDATGSSKVLLDLNLLETLRTKPIFLASKAKRKLERAVWNDTAFLASVDVMDYSLLVGVDDERKELVIGIIDFMRQYTWDKHLESWVKASGILGGPKNATPTVVSPKVYKKRFRKAMSSYFLTVPDQWSS